MQKFLLIFLIIFELFSPIVIWKANLPSSFRYVSILLLVLNLLYGFIYANVKKRFPIGLLFLVLIIVFGTINAIAQEQGLMSSVWGAWQLFKFPMMFVLIANQENLTQGYPAKLIKWSILLVGLQVGVQLIQLALGETDPDQLCGTLSRYQWGGQLPLTLLLVMSFSISLAWGMVSGRYWKSIICFCLATFSGAIAEFKILFFVLPFLVLVSIAIMIRKDLKRAIPFVILLPLGLWLLNSAYQMLLNQSPIEYLTKGELSEVYFDKYAYSYSQSVFVIGRNYFIKLVWDQISESPLTMLFGLGLGSRQESITLGAAGSSLVSDGFDMLNGPSLSIFLGEFGLLGIATLMIFYVQLLIKLWKKQRQVHDPYFRTVVLGLMLYSLLWPVWLWYGQIWSMAIPGVIYWSALGAVFQRYPEKTFLEGRG